MKLGIGKEGIMALIELNYRAGPAFLYHSGACEGHSRHLLYIRHLGGVTCGMIRVLSQVVD